MKFKVGDTVKTKLGLVGVIIDDSYNMAGTPCLIAKYSNVPRSLVGKGYNALRFYKANGAAVDRGGDDIRPVEVRWRVVAKDYIPQGVTIDSYSDVLYATETAAADRARYLVGVYKTISIIKETVDV